MEDRALDLKSSGAAVHIESQRPHLVSLNLDDPLATGVVLYYLHEGFTTLGRAGK
jgi:kinesin family protein 16B